MNIRFLVILLVALSLFPLALAYGVPQEHRHGGGTFIPHVIKSEKIGESIIITGRVISVSAAENNGKKQTRLMIAIEASKSLVRVYRQHKKVPDAINDFYLDPENADRFYEKELETSFFVEELLGQHVRLEIQPILEYGPVHCGHPDGKYIRLQLVQITRKFPARRVNGRVIKVEIERYSRQDARGRTIPVATILGVDISPTSSFGDLLRSRPLQQQRKYIIPSTYYIYPIGNYSRLMGRKMWLDIQPSVVYDENGRIAVVVYSLIRSMYDAGPD